jgi:hypothetical protein
MKVNEVTTSVAPNHNKIRVTGMFIILSGVLDISGLA